MRYNDFEHFLKKGQDALRKGPLAVILAEDLVEVDTTIRHHQFAGFREILLFAPHELHLPEKLEKSIRRIPFNTAGENAMQQVVNRLNDAAPGIWFYYCYNAEYLFYPFSDTRTVGEMLTFHAEERRDAMLTYVVDLYAEDLGQHPNAVSLESAHLDRTGYYALARDRGGQVMDRQLDFFGGLRWRYEEFVPREKRKIDRISLFRSKPGLRLREDFTFSDEEYNTYACPWHHNLTAAVCSFRTAKALRSNAGSMFEIDTFRWHNSRPFEWSGRQLMDLGLMEPGQWF
ncbi:hypothetical protein [Ovoidimarina sediminis]|uniref:hypothetical protein n=1 Tax=Ovoidimarina sediminis TaxID=3079856 RepID=UPI00290ED75A|nr:hypothetical protein [Rhodophyticola sp. MJ-SS7]MDU8946191.1 hypothetical protein [Rhodophyticola sp. MJ-SS7]